MQRGDIYLVNLKNSQGNIQSGKRPVIIVQNNKGNAFAPTVIVCPTTTANKKLLPTHFLIFATSGGLSRNSIVLCEQLFTVNQTDLIRPLGKLNKTNLIKLNNCLKISLGLTKNSKRNNHDKRYPRIRRTNRN